MNTHSTSPLVLLATTVLSAALLAACGGGGSTRPATTATPTMADSPTATVAPTMLPTAPQSDDSSDDATVGAQWTSAHSEQAASGDAGVETDVRIGTHNGYDRIVIQTSGPDAPGWVADIVDEAATQGKGEPITPDGEHLLRVYGQGTHMPLDTDDQALLYSGPRDMTYDGAAVRGLHIDTTFESQFQVVIGMTSTQYRIVTLTQPSRLVIDVAHP